MSYIGVIEGFFGPEWSATGRYSWAAFLQRYGGQFYIYAPKRDQHLRKNWRVSWDESYLSEINLLKSHFQNNGIQFGIGLSPFELGEELRVEDQEKLIEKISLINKMGVDILGIFFDDMKSHSHLSSVQIQVLNIIQKLFHKKIIFCPTFYSFDPLLEKVFGKKPEDYLENLANHLPPKISFAWTGPKVISSEISHDHLIEVTALIRRKPFIWDNAFANDGPKNCQFLKLQSYAGRGHNFLSEIDGIGFNLMNQPYLSQIVFLSSIYSLRDHLSPDQAFEQAVKELCSKKLGDFIFNFREKLLRTGLNNFSDEDKRKLMTELGDTQDPFALDIINWLHGSYLVGPECLTD